MQVYIRYSKRRTDIVQPANRTFFVCLFDIFFITPQENMNMAKNPLVYHIRDIKTAVSSISLRTPCQKTFVSSLFITIVLDSYLTSFCCCLSLISRSLTLLDCRFNFRENSSLSLSRVCFISLCKKQSKYFSLGYIRKFPLGFFNPVIPRVIRAF